ncbi:MAG: Gx transporter family protein [Bacillota bacterium]|nr:Gx transporter family protein [Bacillota bacterium]
MKAKNVAALGVLTAFAMILSYLESLVPLSFAVPGIKMGLPNIVIMFALYRMSLKEACTVSILRVVLISVLFGNTLSLAYSVAGTLLSLTVMTILKKSDKFSVTGVSVAGGVFHNAGQIAVAVILLGTKEIAYYLPVLCISGTIAGICIGAVSGIIINRVKY